MSHPPHLPNPSCSLSLHRLTQRLGVFLLAITAGLIAGLAGGAMAIGWVWPEFGGGNHWLISQISNSNQRIEIEEVVKKETIQKIMTIYKNPQKIGEVFYFSSSDKVGEGVLVSSDGWLAMYLENEKDLNSFHLWRAVNFEGNIYQVEKTVYDKFTKIVYFKIKGITKKDNQEIKDEQFKIVSFAEDGIGTQVFVFQNNIWLYNFLDFEYFLVDKPHLDFVSKKVVALRDKNIPSGSLVFNPQGKMLGLVNEKGEMISSYYLTRVLPGILNKQQIIYSTFFIEGWFSAEQKIVVNNEIQKGFLITNVLKNYTKLQKGDIILEINNQIVENENLWYNLKKEKVHLKILRQGEIFDFEVEVKENIS